MVIETKQTTFVIIAEKPDEEGQNGTDGSDTGTASGSSTSNPYWNGPAPAPTTTTDGNDNPHWDAPAPSTGTTTTDMNDNNNNDNPYWELSSPPEEEDTAPPASSTTSTPGTGTGTSSSTSNTIPEGEGVLQSIRFYDQIRKDLPEDFVRPPEEDATNVELFISPQGEEIAFCHLSLIIPFTQGTQVPRIIAHEDAAAVALAIQDLNSGNGIIVPELEGLNERCNVKFTTEWADTEFAGGVALQHVVEQINRPMPGRTPCAFIGAWRSAVSLPMSIVTGVFERPQISAASTSADLDDASQYPLFGRTIPSDAGNAIPIIIFMHNVLHIDHLTIINVNDAYGNSFVDGLRNAAAIHAPTMQIHQIPLDEGAESVVNAVSNVKAVGYRYIFIIVFTPQTHDAIMMEAYQQGCAGDGFHNWIAGDSFAGVLDGRTFPKDGPLAKSYQGLGLLEVSGGIPGIPKYDAFVQHLSTMNNPIDLETIGGLFPKHEDYPLYDADKYVTGDHEIFLNQQLTSVYAPFHYEATVALGLAACEASQGGTNLKFTGQQHFEAFKNLTFTTVSGPILFNPETGSRDPSSALYTVTNYRQEVVIEENPRTSGQEVVRFLPVRTHLFQQGEWGDLSPYIFNDGTTNIARDLPPPPVEEDGVNVAVLVIIPVIVIAVLAVAVFLFYENQRKKNDSVWVVNKEDIVFADPPEIIGRGTFGLVLLGEYRGTAVAVKRVLPPRNFKGGSGDDKNGIGNVNGGQDEGSSHPLDGSSNHGMASGMRSSTSGLRGGMASGLNSSANGMNGTSSWGGMNMLGNALGYKPAEQKKRSRFQKQNDAAQWRQMKADFLEEMRYLSKLRHPCITTVMGAVTKGEPMLLMEYMDHGSLHDLLHNETMAIEGEIILPLLRDITQGIRYLHSSEPSVIHGDLKAANILVDNRFRAKVADFGLSQKQNLGGTGTPFWMAPELLRGETANTAESDIYSFGIILYEVFSRRDPYDGEEDAEAVLKAVADKTTRKRPPAPLHMPDRIKALMKDCVEDAPDQRPTCEELDTRLKRIDVESLDSNEGNSKKSSQVSLFDIFPRHIAEALRDGRTTEAEHKDCVTIFFCDIVGFTTISSELEPRKVANMLDRLYTKFDALSNKHDIFKVETIGDAYMAVTNLVKDQHDDHAKRIAEFALDAIVAANATEIDPDDDEKGCVNIRVGFHSGPVVADVVGTRNPRYCLFGDTVNTASRMESSSKVNRIHCSRAAAKLVQKQAPSLPMKARGKVKIKGKGDMLTYWVNEGGQAKRHSSLTRDASDAAEIMRNSGGSSKDLFPSSRDMLMSTVDEMSGDFMSGEFGSGEFGDFDSDDDMQPEQAAVLKEPTPFGAAGEEFVDEGKEVDV